MGHRKMPAYGEREHGGRYILDDYVFSRNHNKAERIRRWFVQQETVLSSWLKKESTQHFVFLPVR